MGDLLDDTEVHRVFDEAVDLLGVVRQQADVAEAQILEDLQADHVVALVGLEPELVVRLDGVDSLVLQHIRLELRRQADAAAFLG